MGGQGERNATLLGPLEIGGMRSVGGPQKRKPAGRSQGPSGGLRILDRPVIIESAVPGVPLVKLARIEFAASHPVFLEYSRRWIQSEPLIEHPRLNPAEGSLEGLQSALASPHAVRDSIPADKPVLVHGICPSPSVLLSSASEQPPPLTRSRPLHSASRPPVSHWPVPFEGGPPTFTGSHDLHPP